jgi:hypothetical protein
MPSIDKPDRAVRSLLGLFLHECVTRRPGHSAKVILSKTD